MPRPIKEPSTSRWVSSRNRGSQFTFKGANAHVHSTVKVAIYKGDTDTFRPFIATVCLNDKLWVVSLDCVCNDKTCRARKVRHAIRGDLLQPAQPSLACGELPHHCHWLQNIVLIYWYLPKLFPQFISTEQDMLLRRLGEHCEVHLFHGTNTGNGRATWTCYLIS